MWRLLPKRSCQKPKSILAILEYLVEAADVSVKHTPELLPILKQANVVDSGGKGLFFILEGMLRYLKGQSLETPTTAVQPLCHDGPGRNGRNRARAGL